MTVIDGTGGPAYGPADVVIEGNRVSQVITVGNATSPTQPATWPEYGPQDHVLDLAGHYVLPGLVDAHAHIVPPMSMATRTFCSRFPSASEFVHHFPGLIASHWTATLITVQEAGSVEPQAGPEATQAACPSEKYELFLQVLTGQATQREAAERWGVDRSTVVAVCRTAKQGALDALAAAVPGRPGRSREQLELEAAQAEIERLRATVTEQAVTLHLHQGKSRWD